MKQGFVNQTLDVRTGDGLNDVLLESLDYVAKDGTLYRSPIGSTTDGFSVPRCLQNIIPANGGDWFSAVQHDNSYRNTLLMVPSGIIKAVEDIPHNNDLFVLASLNQKQCDDLILEALESQDCPELERFSIYNALRVCGHFAFSNDRSTP